MSKTRIYQCPHCGELTPTKREKGYIKCSCGTKGEIRRHIVKTAQLTKAQQEKLTEGNGRKATKAPQSKETKAAPAMPWRGSPRFQIQPQEQEDDMTTKTEKDPGKDPDDYGCAECKQPIKKGQKHCPNCGAKLDWSAIAG